MKAEYCKKRVLGFILTAAILVCNFQLSIWIGYTTSMKNFFNCRKQCSGCDRLDPATHIKNADELTRIKKITI